VYTHPEDFRKFEEHIEANHPEAWKDYLEVK